MNIIATTHNTQKEKNGLMPVNLSSVLPHSNPLQEQPTQFASALAHEIRNPLSNINLAAEMLTGTIVEDEQKLYLDIIIRSSERINNLVYDLLTYYHNDKIQFEKYSIHLLIDEVIDITKDRLKLKSIIVKKDYAGFEYYTYGDKKKTKIAFTNIVINAIEAMPMHNGELKLRTSSKNGRCSIEIKDNGIGISKENIKNIFKPYFTSKANGMGLGLATTLDILQSNHIDINVQSEVGIGSCFILSFKSAL
ncbi:MAG TPA: HAMP domain-containing sensor histidine kinase [Puia sp.]|nr:HAMP domain-containing sensor histidine kinase [Puia sp.]